MAGKRIVNRIGDRPWIRSEGVIVHRCLGSVRRQLLQAAVARAVRTSSKALLQSGHVSPQHWQIKAPVTEDVLRLPPSLAYNVRRAAFIINHPNAILSTSHTQRPTTSGEDKLKSASDDTDSDRALWLCVCVALT